MRKIIIDGEEILVPEGHLTGQELRRLARARNDEVLYQINPDGHRVVRDDDFLEVEEGQRFGKMTRVVAALRNIRRIRSEIQVLCRQFGEEAVTWAPDYSWVMIHGVRLPPKYNREATNVLILIPENYGHGQPLQDVFVDPNLRIIVDGEPKEIPHYFPNRNGWMASQFPEQYRKKWRYLCLKQEKWDPKRDSLLAYLNQLYTFLSDPFAWPYQQ